MAHNNTPNFGGPQPPPNSHNIGPGHTETMVWENTNQRAPFQGPRIFYNSNLNNNTPANMGPPFQNETQFNNPGPFIPNSIGNPPRPLMWENSMGQWNPMSPGPPAFGGYGPRNRTRKRGITTRRPPNPKGSHTLDSPDKFRPPALASKSSSVYWQSQLKIVSMRSWRFSDKFTESKWKLGPHMTMGTKPTADYLKKELLRRIEQNLQNQRIITKPNQVRIKSTGNLKTMESSREFLSQRKMSSEGD